MEVYEKMYLHLFNAVSDALEEMKRQNYGCATELLKAAQCCCEEQYIKGEEET